MAAAEVEKLSWVVLKEGALMVARALAPGTGDSFTQEVKVRAVGLLLQALRIGAIESRGWPDERERRPLTTEDWQRLRPDIENSRLLESPPTLRRVHHDRIFDVEVDVDDVRKLASGLTVQVGKEHGASEVFREDQRKIGRPPSANWAVIKDLLASEIRSRGCFPDREEGPQGWRTQNDAIEFVRTCVHSRSENVQQTALADNTRRMLAELKSENLEL